MVSIKRTQHTLIIIAIALFILSVVLTVASGISLQIALIDNALDSLQVSYVLIPLSAASNPLILTSKLLDSAIFPMITVILAAWFFDFISNINLRERIVLSKINRLKGHVIIAPYNSFAKALQQELRNSGIKPVTIVENKRELLHLYREGELAIQGDIRSAETFDIAGINRARCVVACSRDDIQNALVTITAKAVNQSIDIIVKANDEQNLDRLERAGVYKTILVESTAGQNIGDEMVKRLLSKRGFKNE